MNEAATPALAIATVASLASECFGVAGGRRLFDLGVHGERSGLGKELTQKKTSEGKRLNRKFAFCKCVALKVGQESNTHVSVPSSLLFSPVPADRLSKESPVRCTSGHGGLRIAAGLE